MAYASNTGRKYNSSKLSDHINSFTGADDELLQTMVTPKAVRGKNSQGFFPGNRELKRPEKLQMPFHTGETVIEDQ